MTPAVSVVVPVYNGEQTLDACLQSLAQQSMKRDLFEIIVVDDGSKDRSAEIARRYGATVIVQANAGAPAARNAGIAAARGTWIAFTDSDCVCSRTWLASLVAAAERETGAIGAAGKTIGFRSQTAAARFVDLMGGLDPIRSLAHPRFPFAPTSNALYRREYVVAAGGFDTRYATYDACDLHTRLRRLYDARFTYEERALVMHRHRQTWRAYWRQQFFYGVGYAQFALAYRKDVRWTALHQVRAGIDLAVKAFGAVLPGHDDAALLRRGWLVRAAAQQAGFVRTYYNPRERRRW
ncbi:MAG TPA: glycosyltransferase [Candidatus Baltobacteraceae bacterium]